MDIQMPVLDGISASIQIKQIMKTKNSENLYIVGCSANDIDLDLISKTKNNKIMDFVVSKPIYYQ